MRRPTTTLHSTSGGLMLISGSSADDGSDGSPEENGWAVVQGESTCGRVACPLQHRPTRSHVARRAAEKRPLFAVRYSLSAIRQSTWTAPRLLTPPNPPHNDIICIAGAVRCKNGDWELRQLIFMSLLIYPIISSSFHHSRHHSRFVLLCISWLWLHFLALERGVGCSDFRHFASLGRRMLFFGRGSSRVFFLYNYGFMSWEGNAADKRLGKRMRVG